MPHAVVLGAGISGLAAARRLAADGFDVTVLEAAASPGGMLRTLEHRGFIVELGPTLVPDSRALRELCADAACETELVPASSAARRGFLVHDRRLIDLPSHPKDLVTTPLLSARGKLRLLGEPLQGRGPGPEESVAAFFSRRFGHEAADSLAAAFVVGIFGGDYRELAIGYAAPEVYDLEQRHGSLMRGMTQHRGEGGPRRPLTFRPGLGRLAERLAAGLELRCGIAATSLETTGAGFLVRALQGRRPRRFEAERVVVALPAAAAARLLGSLGSTAGLAALPHAPVATLALAYTEVPLAREGIGLLVPPKERCRLLGCFFTSTLFPHTAPPGAVLLTASLGGRLHPELVALDDGALAAIVEEELRRLLGVRERPEVLAIERWRPGIPQPTAAMVGVRREIDQLHARLPGLRLIGGWADGPSVAHCVRAGWRL